MSARLLIRRNAIAITQQRDPRRAESSLASGPMHGRKTERSLMFSTRCRASPLPARILDQPTRAIMCGILSQGMN